MIKNEPLVAEILNCGCGRGEVVHGSGTGAGLLQHMGVSAEERLRHRAGQRNMVCDLYFCTFPATFALCLCRRTKASAALGVEHGRRALEGDVW